MMLKLNQTAMLPKFLTKRKIALALLLFFLFSILLSKPIQAFSTKNSTYQFQFEQAIRSPEMNLQSFVYETLKAVAGSIVTTIAGCWTCSREEGNSFGMIGTVSTLIAGIYATPPASGIAYLADIGERLQLIQPTYAQEGGAGFGKLDIYLPIWRSFRNISYVFFILIFVFIGFAIMFRVKINPQTVISIQSALPKIVLALILVTFSYAIVGFLIDLMLVVSNLIMFTFKNMEGVPQFAKDWIFIINRPATSSIEILAVMLQAGYPPFAVSMIIVWLATTMITLITAVIPFTQPFAIPAAIGGIIILLLFLLIFLIALIRVLWTLLKAYVFVVLNLIFAPFMILVGTLPGSNAVGSWFKSLLANLAVLPTVITMVFLSGYLTLSGIVQFFNETVVDLLNAIFRETGDPTPWIVQLGRELQDIPGSVLGMLVLICVSVGILLLTPKVADMIQAFLAGKPFGYGAAIGEAMGPVRIGAAFGLGAGAARVARDWGDVERGRFMTVIGELQKMLTRGSSRGSRS